ncbi:KCNQ2 [Symbiodinium natans]|uniref:KCNQ2 protein n=1 Tax=Symbiodinium natans TaxID=878477 RepID=A0A812TYA1_9DINO|nr:KCNQ2 [Symbiodinium natans]
MMISEDVEEELFRLGASSDTIKKLQEFDDMVHEPMSGNLDGSIRTKALRCMFKMLQANGLAGENTWFKAALLLDRLTASSFFRLEQLPLTCVCLTKLVVKCISSVPKMAHEEDPSMILIKDFATWLDSTQSSATSAVSLEALRLHEEKVLGALDWQVEVACTEKWCLVYFTRFGLVGREFQAPVRQLHAQALLLARAVMMCFPMLSHKKLAAGLFCLSFVYSGLLPMASLMPSDMNAAEWSALLAATGNVPQCRLPQAMTLRLMHMICLAMKEGWEDIRAWSRQTVETLGETFRQVRMFHDGQGPWNA